MNGVERVIAGLVDELVAGDPVLATSLGRREGLDALASFSPSAVAARVALAHRGLEQLVPVAAEGSAGQPPSAAAADAAAAIAVLRRLLRRYELRRVHHVVPSFYLDHVNWALLPVMMRDLAPDDERLRALDSRLRALPGVFEEARANLEPGLPTVFVEKALDLADGLLELVGVTVREFARDMGRPGMLDAASAIAQDALARFHDHLRDQLLPVSVATCGAGRAVLADVLRHEHMLDETPEQIAAIGRGLIAETQAEMGELAAAMGYAAVDAAVAAVRHGHPRLEGLIPDYRRAVEEARAYVVSHDLVTLADGEELKVVATPRCLRAALPFAAYDPPGPFADRQLGYYYVTPPRGMAGQALEEALAAHPSASMPTTGVHEAYPGHHVQITRANRASTLARRVAGVFEGGTLLVEGWAFYCEEMMERQGFLAAPEVRLMRLSDQVWRACRVVIDAEVATGRMSFAEAVALLAREARMDARLAELEVRWYVESPGDPMSYLLGKREVVGLARSFARRRTASLKTFHDALLDWGCVSPRLIAWGLGLAERPAAFSL